jgi:hypothetical protein
MTCYIVSFQAKELATRNAIRKQLKSYDLYCLITTSTWAVVTDDKAKDIRNALGELIDDEDRVFVIRSGTEGAWRNAGRGSETNEWLKENL